MTSDHVVIEEGMLGMLALAAAGFITVLVDHPEYGPTWEPEERDAYLRSTVAVLNQVAPMLHGAQARGVNAVLRGLRKKAVLRNRTA